MVLAVGWWIKKIFESSHIDCQAKKDGETSLATIWILKVTKFQSCSFLLDNWSSQCSVAAQGKLFPIWWKARYKVKS